MGVFQSYRTMQVNIPYSFVLNNQARQEPLSKYRTFSIHPALGIITLVGLSFI